MRKGRQSPPVDKGLGNMTFYLTCKLREPEIERWTFCGD
jgi:hypothetical protein